MSLSIYNTSAFGNSQSQLRLSVSGKLEHASNKMLKRGIWIYFFLLIFEGALRKWLLPQFSTPLLVIRDPLAIWLLIKAWNRGLFLSSAYIFWMSLIGITCVFTTIFFGHGNIIVALYGARILFLHFPLIFVIGQIFNREDVIKIGRAVLLLSIPMVLLIILQFYSPQSAWVNLGVGGDTEGAGFGGALGYFRPPGTFSFTNGTHLFFGLVASYLFYFWLNNKSISRLLLISATVALLVAIPFSISRSLFFHVIIAMSFATIASLQRPRLLFYMIISVLIGSLIVVFLSKYSFFQTATQAFIARFETANDAEGGVQGVLGDRYLGGMIGALSNSTGQPYFGYGIGMGTNVGSMLLTGSKTFLIAEEEWARCIGEMGPLLGISFILVRLAFSLKLVLSSVKKLILHDVLPWMLLSFGLLTIPQGQWAQPTSLGFSILIGGLILASLKKEGSQIV